MELLKHSPLTFKVVTEPLEATRANDTPDFKPVRVAAPLEIHFAEREEKQSQQTPPAHESDPIKTFRVWVQLSESKYTHKTNIRRNPIHGRWPPTRRQDQDFVYYALREVVPTNIAREGLCDWATGGQLSEDAMLARLDQEVAANSQIAERLARRKNRENLAVDDHELVGWSSLYGAPTPADRGSDRTPAKVPDGESVFDSASETISESLRLESHPSHSQEDDASEAEIFGNSREAQSDHSHVGKEAIANSTSKKTLQRILGMSASSNAASSLESSSESSPFEPSGQSGSSETPVDHKKET